MDQTMFSKTLTCMQQWSMVLKEIVQSLIVFYSSVGRPSLKFQSVGFPENNSLFLLTPNGIPKVTCCSIG